MNEMNSSNKDIYIKDIDDLESNDSSNSKQTITTTTTTTSSSLNTTTTTTTASSALKQIKIDYLNVPSMDNAFTVHRNNSLLKKQPIQNRESIMNRNKLEKQKCFNSDELNTITVLNDNNNNNNNNNNNTTSDDDNYAIKSKEENNNNSKLNSISIVISPFIDDDDLNNNNNNEENINNNNNKQEENKSQENHNLNIDLSIFELLDNSSKKFILKPVNMSLTIKSQVFRTKGMYPEYKFYLENFTDNLLLVMTARKRKKTKNTCYIINYISYDQTDIEKFIETPIAKLKSNLIGTQFVLYDFGIKPNKINENKHLLITATGGGGSGGGGGQLGVHSYINEYDSSLSKTNSFDTNCSSDTESNDIQLLSSLRKEYLSISYELNFFGYKGPRQMFVIIPGMDNEFNR